MALWIQTISAKIFGFSGLSLLLPEALAGVASVALLYFLVQRASSARWPAFVAALALALTPIAVAVERTNNTDTWLMFTLLLAAWAMTLATEKGRFALLALGLALVGVAFNIKMLAAFVVLPTFYLLYLVAAPLKWQKRLLHLAPGQRGAARVALSWPLAVDLTPADQRPWVGGSQTNSVLDLALDYNGLGRVTGNEGAGGGPGGWRRSGGRPGDFATSATPGNLPRPRTASGGQPGRSTRNAGPAASLAAWRQHPERRRRWPRGRAAACSAPGFAGPLRLFTGGELAEQWSWLFPLALLGLLAAVLACGASCPSSRAVRRCSSGAAGWSPTASSSAWPRASSTPTT